jgi:FG-GAP repeat protein
MRTVKIPLFASSLVLASCVAVGSGGSETRLLEGTLSAPEDAKTGCLGASLAISGDTAVLGSPCRDDGTGAALVYQRVGSSWSRVGELLPLVRVPDDLFGASVALSGDTAVIGTSHGGPAGAAQVFVRRGAMWIPQTSLRPDEDVKFGLGSAVALSGDTAAVAFGTDLDSNGSTNNHVTCVYRREGGGWSAPLRLPQSAYDAPAAMSGDTLVFLHDGWKPDPADDTFDPSGEDPSGGTSPPAEPPSVTIFARSADGLFEGGWTKQATLVPSGDATSSSLYGSAALSGDTVLVGVPGSGVHVFTRIGASWTEQTTLVAPETAPIDTFGAAVALSGDTAVVGAPGSDVFVFQRSGASWSLRETLKAPALGETGDFHGFGASVAISGSAVLISASGSGAAYVYRLGAL